MLHTYIHCCAEILLQCEPGTQANYKDNSCTVCPTGQFKSQSMHVCKACPVGSSTLPSTFPADHDDLEDCSPLVTGQWCVLIVGWERHLSITRPPCGSTSARNLLHRLQCQHQSIMHVVGTAFTKMLLMLHPVCGD